MTITSLYKKKCGELLLPLGFQLHKNRFWRVVDEMYQALSFHISGNYCQVCFGIIPFCMGLDLKSALAADCERHSLSVLSLTQDDWSFSNKNPETITTVIDLLSGVIQSRLIPFFEQTTSCANAYEKMRSLYQHNQRLSLSREDWAKSFESDIWFFGDVRFYILLKLGRLNEAQRLQLALREHMETISQEGWSSEVNRFGEEKALRRQMTRLAPIDARIELTKHPEQVRLLIEENEQKSHESINSGVADQSSNSNTYRRPDKDKNIMACIPYIMECGRLSEVAAVFSYQCKELRENNRKEIVTEIHAAGGETIHRGYYCPSPVRDIIENECNRGKLLKSLTTRCKPTYKYCYNSKKELILVDQLYAPRETCEILLLQGKIETGITFTEGFGVCAISECTYQNGQIMSYVYALYDSLGGCVVEYRKEEYTYSTIGLEVADIFKFLRAENILQYNQYHFQHDESGYLSSYTYTDQSVRRSVLDSHVFDVRLKRKV